MSLAPALKILTRQECLSEEAARRVAGALLDGGVPELEQGALLALLDRRADKFPELAGYVAALAERSFRLVAPPGPAHPIVFCSQNGTDEVPNLLPLLALSLQRLKLTVVIHGALSVPGRVLAAQVLRELRIMPCVTLGQAQATLDARAMAFIPTAVLATGLAHMLALRARLGFGAFAERMARLVDPFGGNSLLVLAAADEEERLLLHTLLRERPGTYLLLVASHGDAFADPRQRPLLELVRDGTCEVLFDAQAAPMHPAVGAPASSDPRAIAAWTHSVLRGERPMPMPLVNQVACCLYGAGYTADMNQAKAIAAVETGSLLAA